MSNYIKVRATVAVAGMWAGDDYVVDGDNDFIQLLLRVGHLQHLEDVADEVEILPELDAKLAELDAAEDEPVEEKKTVVKNRAKIQPREIDGEKSSGTVEA